MKSWSWSRSWRKRLAVFQDFCCNSWRQWARHTMHFVRENKSSVPFGSHCLREPSALRASSVERIFSNGSYLLGHTDTIKARCIYCGKLLSLVSNKPGKQTVHGLKRCHLEKCHKDINTLYMRKVESRQQGPPAKKPKLERYWWCIVGLTWWLNVWKNTNIIRWLSFVFVFRPKWMSVFILFRFWS